MVLAAAPQSRQKPQHEPQSPDYDQPLLFECAWEVANKVGGIYTVIRTKVPVTVEEYGERYCLLGPLAHRTASMEVEPLAQAHLAPVEHALQNMRDRGVHIQFGRWLIEGAPYVVLFDLESVRHRLNEWKSNLWEAAQIPTPDNDFETNDAVVFGYVVAWFLGEVAYQARMDLEAQRARRQIRAAQPVILAQFHEWLSGVALILAKVRRLEVATIFTTHATLLGRYLCAGEADFYNHLRSFDVDYEAGKRGIYHRYCIERGAAHSADVFTTVSHITAYEAEWLLKRRPDGVLPNGLNVVKFSALHEFQNLHVRSKEKIHEFVRGHFYGHLDFDLDNTLYLFTAGRYEYRNKGVDMFIEALARLNARLQHAQSPVTVVAFIIMPATTLSYAVEALKGQAVMKQLRDTVTEIQSEMGRRIFEEAARGQLPDRAAIMREEELILLKRRTFALKRNTLPPIVTHNMADDAADPILNHIRRVQLFNRPGDRVKIIFHPEFLSSNSPLFGLDYDDFVRGCHMGVFPSYYEPWGYTPAECTVMGIPSITTNLSGFGCFMEEMIEEPKDYGIYIVDRRLKSIDESVNQLADYMAEFATKTRRQRINQRNRTERLSDLLDWKRLGLEYMKARWVAIRRKWPTFLDTNRPAGVAGVAGVADDDAEVPAPAAEVPPVNMTQALENSVRLDQANLHRLYPREAATASYTGEPPKLFGPIANKLARPPSVPGSPRIPDEDDGVEQPSGIAASSSSSSSSSSSDDSLQSSDESASESDGLHLGRSAHLELPTLSPSEFEPAHTNMASRPASGDGSGSSSAAGSLDEQRPPQSQLAASLNASGRRSNAHGHSRRISVNEDSTTKVFYGSSPSGADGAARPSPVSSPSRSSQNGVLSSTPPRVHGVAPLARHLSRLNSSGSGVALSPKNSSAAPASPAEATLQKLREIAAAPPPSRPSD